MGVIGISIVLGCAPLVSLVRQKKRGAAAKAQLLELINDLLGLVAALLGTLVVMWGYPLADPIASLAVATIITVNGIGLFRENLSYLLGRSPGAEFFAKVDQAARSVEHVVGVHAVRAEYIGSDSLNVDLHIEVPLDTVIERANAIAHQVAERVDALTPGPDYVSVHVDPEGIAQAAAARGATKAR